MAVLPINLNTTVSSVYKKTIESQEVRRSNGIGISTLGENCSRKLWYAFRWALPVKKLEDGQLLRLFARGHRAEAEMINEIRSIGCELYDRNPQTGDQFRVEEFGGHLSGYLDGVVRGIPEAPKKWHVLEIKTHNEKNFKKLSISGIRRSHPKHYTQCQMGMGLASPRLERALYFAECKNDSSLYSERIRFDLQFFLEMIAKARSIIFGARAPERIGSADCFDCSYCDFKKLCHEPLTAAKILQNQAVLPEKNCRTCLYSMPREDGSWFCSKRACVLEKDLQLLGCEKHLFHPDLINADNYLHGTTPTDNWSEYLDINGMPIWNHEGGEISDTPF